MLLTKPKSPELMEIFHRVGSMSALAQHLGITKAAVSSWRKVPVHHVRAICKLTGLKADQVRPDIFAGWDLAA